MQMGKNGGVYKVYSGKGLTTWLGDKMRRRRNATTTKCADDEMRRRRDAATTMKCDDDEMR